MSDVSALKKFSFQRVLDEDPLTHTLILLGTLPNSSETLDSENTVEAIVRVERTTLSAKDAPLFFGDNGLIKKTALEGSTDIVRLSKLSRGFRFHQETLSVHMALWMVWRRGESRFRYQDQYNMPSDRYPYSQSMPFLCSVFSGVKRHWYPTVYQTRADPGSRNACTLREIYQTIYTGISCCPHEMVIKNQQRSTQANYFYIGLMSFSMASPKRTKSFTPHLSISYFPT